MTTPAIVQQAHALAAVLQHADNVGLPMPFVAAVHDYREVTLQLNTLDDLSEWAVWLDEPTAESEHEGHTHHIVVGQALEQAIEARAITSALVEEAS